MCKQNRRYKSIEVLAIIKILANLCDSWWHWFQTVTGKSAKIIIATGCRAVLRNRKMNRAYDTVSKLQVTTVNKLDSLK